MERQVSVWCVAAIGLWVTTVLFILSGTLTALNHTEGTGLAVALALMAHGLACSAAAATVTIRNMFTRQNRLITSAYDLGREAGQVRRLGR